MWAMATIAFALAYGQFPLYEGNYNTYLLHGFAAAGRGQLEHDWLAQTLDPFPVFSALVTPIAALDWKWLFYVGHGLLLGVYLYATVHLVEGVHGQDRLTRTAALAAILAVPQVWLGRDAISYVFDGDWGWYLQAGVAMQYVLGHMFQPSMFGVSCVASLAAFGRRWDRTALALAAVAVLFHFSYFITAAGLIAGYSWVRWRETGNARATLRYAALGCILFAAASLPVLRFLPTDGATAAEAARILADVRVPHHAWPARWLNQPGIFWVQTPLLVAGALLAWRTRIRWAYVLVLALGVALLAAQVLTGNRQLALLFPWRVSVILVPVASSLVIGALALRFSARLSSRYAGAAAAIVAVLAASYGYRHTQKELQAYGRDPVIPLLHAASAMATPQTLFAIPTSMERFRLETVAPTLVDYKAHPFSDVEVVEWYARISLADELDASDSPEACDVAARLHERYGVTHFVRPSSRQLVCRSLVTAFEDESFVIQRWL